MKRFTKIMFVFAFAFLLTRLQMGTGQVYYSGNGSESTSDISQAKVFNTLGEAYEMQNKLNGDWEIKSIS